MKEYSSPIFDKIETSKQLPSLPHILLNLIEACNKEESNIKVISQIINKDSSLSAKVMSLINSAYYYLPKKVTNMGQALVLLGTESIINIAISASVNHVFGRVNAESGFDLKEFWWHSLMCAILSKSIAKRISYDSPDEAFLSGLVHDIGKLVLWVNFTREYKEILQSSYDKTGLLLAEQNYFGVTHSEVGHWLVKRWKIQSFIPDAVLYHHEPLDRILNSLPLIKIVYVSNLLSTEIEIKSQSSLNIAEEILDLPRSQIEEIDTNARAEIDDIAENLGIEIRPQTGKSIKVNDTDYKKEEKLAQELKNISLLQGTLQNLLKTRGEDSILSAINQGFQVIFDIKINCFFKYDQERDTLIGKSLAGYNKFSLINKMLIPFQKGKNILIDSLKGEMPIDSFSYFKEIAPAIIDEQLIRLTGNDGIMTLPMVVQKKYIGILVLGLNETQSFLLQKNFNLLSMFISQATNALNMYYLRQSQAKLILSKTIKATSTLSQKIVHEVNTPLSIIKNFIKILEMKFSEKNIHQDELQIMNEEINRITNSLHGLSDFSITELQKSNPTDINEALSEVVEIFKESLMLGFKINFHLNFDLSLPLINSDKDRLKQVFINLIQNSIDSLSPGGNIHITTKYITNASDNKILEGLGTYFEYAEIEFIDDGPGIPENIKSRLFEPFITSKGEKHKGLGLSIVYTIVKELKGNVTFKSNTANGTVFKIVLPISRNFSY